MKAVPTCAALLLALCLCGCPSQTTPGNEGTGSPTPADTPHVQGAPWTLALDEPAQPSIEVDSSGTASFSLENRSPVQLSFRLDNERVESLDKALREARPESWKPGKSPARLRLVQAGKKLESDAKAAPAVTELLRQIRPQPGKSDAKELWIAGRLVSPTTGSGIVLETEKQKYVLEPSSELMTPGMVVVVTGQTARDQVSVAMNGPVYNVQSWAVWSGGVALPPAKPSATHSPNATGRPVPSPRPELPPQNIPQ